MSLLLKKIRKKVKEFKGSYSEVRYYRAEAPVLYIDLKPNTKVRSYLNLIFLLKQSYSQPIVIRFSLFHLFILSKWFGKIDNLYFSKPFKKTKVFRKFSHKKSADFRMDYEYQRVYEATDYIPNVIPYIMHPQNYISGLETIDSKHVGIIISGNFERKIYDNPTLMEKFGVLNRSVIYDKLISLPGCRMITGDELVNKYKTNEYLDKLVLMKWQSGAIPSAKWRYYLSTAKFIFCAPGMTMPLCHNVIEALSVGVVPILNYKDWLNPSLTDGVNCFTYDNLDSVESVVRKALALDSQVYEALRKSCMEYYTAYYSKFDFEKFRNGRLTLVNEDKRNLPKSKSV